MQQSIAAGIFQAAVLTATPAALMLATVALATDVAAVAVGVGIKPEQTAD